MSNQILTCGHLTVAKCETIHESLPQIPAQNRWTRAISIDRAGVEEDPQVPSAAAVTEVSKTTATDEAEENLRTAATPLLHTEATPLPSEEEATATKIEAAQTQEDPSILADLPVFVETVELQPLLTCQTEANNLNQVDLPKAENVTAAIRPNT